MACSINRLLGLIYPRVCLHCQEETLGSHLPLCPACISLMELVSPLGRCQRCFEKEERLRICAECRMKTPYFHKHFSACDAMGPAKTLVFRYSQGDFFLAEALASWMALQYLAQELPLPDFVVPLPGSLLTRLYRGEDLNTLLAKKMSALLERPLIAALRYVWNEEHAQFCLRPKYAEQITDKHILLISSTFVRKEIESAAKALKERFPKRIESLSFS